MKLSHIVTLLLLAGLLAVARADEDSAQSELDNDTLTTILNTELTDGSEGEPLGALSDDAVQSSGDPSTEDIDAKIAEVKNSVQELKKKKKELKESGAKALAQASSGTKSSAAASSSEPSEEEHNDQQDGSTANDETTKESTPTSADSSSDINWSSWFSDNVAPALDDAKMKDASSEEDSANTDVGDSAKKNIPDASSDDNWKEWFAKEVTPSLDEIHANSTASGDENSSASSDDNWKEWFSKEVAPSLDKSNESSTSSGSASGADSSDDNWKEWFDKEVAPSLDKISEATTDKSASSKSSAQTSTESATQNAIEVAKLKWRIEMSKGNVQPNTTDDITTQKELSKLKEKEAELAERSKDLLMREATTSTPPPNASAKKYDREAAVAYANKFWNSKLRINHDCSQAYHLCTPYAFYGSGCSYPISHGGDTANFVSQALLAGSHPALNKGECRGVCGAEPNMRRLVSCLTTHYGWSRVCGYNAAIPEELSAGDIIAYHDNRGCSSEPVHMALVVRVENGFAYVTSHDEDVQGQNHQFFYPKGKYVSYLHYNG